MLLQIALLLTLSDASAYIVPRDQWDPPVAIDMLEALANRGVLVQRATATFEAGGKTYPQGTWVIPPNPHIDALSVEMGVSVEAITAPITASLERVRQFHAEGGFRGQGPTTTLDHRDNSAFIATAFLLDRFEGVNWTADGTIVLDSWYADGFARAENFSKQFVVRITLTDNPNLKPVYQLQRPRAAIMGTADWLTKILDENAAPYTVVHDLTVRYDTMMVADSPRDLVPFDAFLRSGGTLIVLPKEASTSRRISIDTKNPLAFGMPTETRVHASNLADPKDAAAIAKFEDGSAALTESTIGKGHILTFHFRPEPGTAKLLLNAIYLGSARRL